MSGERPLEELSDGELARVGAGSGDRAQAAFETLYWRYREFVYRVAMRQTRDHELALDAAQEAFAYLHGRLGRIVIGEAGTLAAYLYPVAKNSAVTVLRKRRRGVAQGRESAEHGAGVDQTRGAGAWSEEELRVLRECVDTLPEEQREVLLLRVVDGLSVGEVSLALGIAEGTVKSRLRLALERLRLNVSIRGMFGEEEEEK